MTHRTFAPKILILLALLLALLVAGYDIRLALAQDSRPAQEAGPIVFGEGASITLTGFTADGHTTITLNYTGSVPDTVTIYRSSDGIAQDLLLDSVSVTDPDGSQDFVLGTDIDLVNGAGEIDYDYYLLAVSTNASTALFEGAYHYPSDMVFIHGRDTLTDTIGIARSGTDLQVTWNLLSPYTYPLADVTDVRARSHGNDDRIDAAGLTGPATTPTYQMGGAGKDRLIGGNGNDVLVGGPGGDILNGLGSTDKASYLDSPSEVVADIALGSASSDGWGTTDTFIALQNLEGSEFDDLLNGNSTHNFIHGQGGNDTINGRDGYDTLFGGPGVDTISGGNQDDSITGGNDDDWLDGGSGNDVIAADNGNDTIYGGPGTDSLLGHAGNDIIFGGGSNDSIYGGNEAGPNDDNLFGEGGNDTIYGGVGNDNLYGGLGTDTLYGGDGDDDLFAHNATPCSSDGVVDTLNGGTHVFGDDGFYTFAQDTALAIESPYNCP